MDMLPYSTVRKNLRLTRSAIAIAELKQMPKVAALISRDTDGPSEVDARCDAMAILAAIPPASVVACQFTLGIEADSDLASNAPNNIHVMTTQVYSRRVLGL